MVATGKQDAETETWTSGGNIEVSRGTKVSEMVESFIKSLGAAEDMGLDPRIASARETGSAYLTTIPTVSSRQEAWRYTNVKRLFEPFFNTGDNKSESVSESDVAPYIDEACADACLVFVDGLYRDDLSSVKDVSPGVHFTTIQKGDLVIETAQRIANGKYLEHMVDKNVKPRDSFGSDVLAAMNMKDMVDAAVLHVPSNVRSEQPMQLLYFSSGAKGSHSSPHTLVMVETGGEAHLKQTFAGAASGQPVLVNSNTHSVVAPEAVLTHTYFQELGEEARHLESLTADISGEGAYEVSIVQMGARLGRINAHLHMLSEKANATINGTLLAHTRQSLDMHTHILHGAENCISRQQQRNVVGDKGEAIFKGRIVVPKIAQGTDSDQLCRTLMLGDRARVIAMPTLEITADDVVASHGASVADLDENSMFYLSSRGIDRLQARKLLLKGFVFEMLGGCIMDETASARVGAKLESLNPDQDIVGQGSQKFASI